MQGISILPTNFDQAMKYSEMIAASDLCPTWLRKKPADIFITIQMGIEVGLSPMQAMQSIAVINGKPGLYGDGLLAVARGSSSFESMNEWMEGNIADGTAVAYCAIKRKGQELQTRKFSIDDAKSAGLWGKSGPWTQYKGRMLQMRARGFALRDVFADVLKGINIIEDIIEAEIVTNNKENKVHDINNTLGIIEDKTNIHDISEFSESSIEFENDLQSISNAKTEEEATELWKKYYKKYRDSDKYNIMLNAKNERKKYFNQTNQEVKND